MIQAVLSSRANFARALIGVTDEASNAQKTGVSLAVPWVPALSEAFLVSLCCVQSMMNTSLMAKISPSYPSVRDQ